MVGRGIFFILGIAGANAWPRSFLARNESWLQEAKVTDREATCRWCFRQCPVNCFVGTCGLNFGFEVQRFKATNQCWSCEASSGLGIAEQGDYVVCSGQEASAVAYRPPQKFVPLAPSNADVDAIATAASLKEAANQAMANAQTASAKAEELSQAAAAKYNAVGTKASDADLAQAHYLAEMIRAADAKKGS